MTCTRFPPSSGCPAVCTRPIPNRRGNDASLLPAATPAPACLRLDARALAQPAYALVFGPENSSPGAIDNAGRIVGQVDGRAFLWDGGAVIDLGTLGGGSSAAFGISDNGLITGGADRPDGSSHSFLYDGGIRDIGQLGVASSGAAVNSAGQVAGTWVDAAGENHAFLYSGGLAVDIGNRGADSARATGINDNGQVAGTSFIDEETLHAFLYTGGVLQDIGSFGGAFTEARGLNDAGWVIGYSTYADDVPGIDFSSAFVYRDGAMFDLNAIVERPGVWSILDAWGVNDLGQIAATACTQEGDCRAVRLDPIPPVPEPKPGALMLAGLLLGGAWLRRGMRRRR